MKSIQKKLQDIIMPQTDDIWTSKIDKPFIRERGKVLVNQIVNELRIADKVDSADEATRMLVFKRTAELVALERSKLTGPEQHLLREYVRKGALGVEDPDRMLDLHSVENVGEAIAPLEQSRYKYGSLENKLLFCAVPQQFATKSSLQRLIGIFTLLFCTLYLAVFPLILYTWGAICWILHYPVGQSLIMYLSSYAGSSAAIIMCSAISGWFTWRLRRIAKAERLDEKHIHEARHHSS